MKANQTRHPQPGQIVQVSDPNLAMQANPATLSGLTTDSTERKGVPIFSGVLRYFPDALADVARLSKIGNDKHNPGEPLHWSRGKSNDHGDCIVRHQIEFDQIDTDKVLHATKVAWRALAQLQTTIEELRAKGVQYP